MIPFLIVSLPRSRSAWLSNYFTNGDIICYHERLRHFPAPILIESLEGKNGDSDSMLCTIPDQVLMWEQLGKVKILVVDRNQEEVFRSLEKLFDNQITGEMMRLALDGFNQIKRKTKGMIVKYHDLNDMIEVVHSYITPHIPFSEERFRLLENFKITQIK